MQHYEIIFDYNLEILTVEEETTDYGGLVDILIDKLEEEYGSDSRFFVPPENTIENGGDVHEDEYIIGGNHGLLLYTGGNFNIAPLNPENPSYTTYEETDRNGALEPDTRTLNEWKEWFNQYGDKDEYADAQEWLFDMISMGILIPEKESFFE